MITAKEAKKIVDDYRSNKKFEDLINSLESRIRKEASEGKSELKYDPTANDAGIITETVEYLQAHGYFVHWHVNPNAKLYIIIRWI